MHMDREPVLVGHEIVAVDRAAANWTKQVIGIHLLFYPPQRVVSQTFGPTGEFKLCMRYGLPYVAGLAGFMAQKCHLWKGRPVMGQSFVQNDR